MVNSKSGRIKKSTTEGANQNIQFNYISNKERKTR